MWRLAMKLTSILVVLLALVAGLGWWLRGRTDLPLGAWLSSFECGRGGEAPQAERTPAQLIACFRERSVDAALELGVVRSALERAVVAYHAEKRSLDASHGEADRAGALESVRTALARAREAETRKAHLDAHLTELVGAAGEDSESAGVSALARREVALQEGRLCLEGGRCSLRSVEELKVSLAVEPRGAGADRGLVAEAQRWLGGR
jgi:hypothetical protein